MVVCGTIHAADGGVVKLPVLGIVHLHAIKVNVVVARVVTTELEACGAEEVTYVAGVHIVVRVDHNDILCHIVVLAQLRLCEDKGGIVLFHCLFAFRSRVLCILCKAQ